MDPLASPSFIPKKPLVADSRDTRRGGTSLIALIAILIFVTSLVAAGAAFAYQQYLKSAIASKSASLSKAREAYGTETIDDLVRLNSRLTSGKKVLATHLSASGVFAFLSSQTLEKVQFSSFGLDVTQEEGAKLTLKGEADSFSTIALQSDQFGGSKVLSDVVFSSIVIAPETGKVTFAVDAVVDPSLLLYSQNFGNVVAAPPVEESVQPPPSSTSTPATSSPKTP